MKKLLSILLAMLLLIAIPASAATAKKAVTKKTVTKKTTVVTKASAKKAKAPKNVPVVITSIPDGVVIGQAMTITATTQRQGSALVESVWYVNDVKITDSKAFTTVFDKTKGKYVSTLTYTPSGNFKVSYSIKMGAGKSSVSFVGKAEKSFTIGIAKVTDFTIAPESMILTEQPAATTDPADTVKKYTLAISKINVTREFTNAAVLTPVDLKVTDITTPTDATPYKYSLTFDGFTKEFTLTLDDFNKLLTPVIQPTPTPTVTP